MYLHNVIDATTGRTILSDVTIEQLDRWYDAHCYWRAPRDIVEVHPMLRDQYIAADDYTHFYVQD